MPQVLVDAELKIERGRLEHDADLPAHLLRRRDNIASEYPDRAVYWRDQRGDDLEQRRLTTAIRAEQPEELADRHAEADGRQRRAGAVPVAQVGDLEGVSAVPTIGYQKRTPDERVDLLLSPPEP